MGNIIKNWKYQSDHHSNVVGFFLRIVGFRKNSSKSMGLWFGFHGIHPVDIYYRRTFFFMKMMNDLLKICLEYKDWLKLVKCVYCIVWSSHVFTQVL